MTYVETKSAEAQRTCGLNLAKFCPDQLSGYALKPNEKDIQRFWHMAGCRRKVWNLAHALQQQRLANSDRLFTYSELAKQLLVWKSDPSYAYLKDCHS